MSRTTTTPSCTATVATPPWSRGCPSSGSSPSTSSRGRRSTPSTPARSPSTPRAGRRPTPPGWRTSRTGASAASCGGATASPCSTARTAAGRTPLPRTPTCAPSAAAITCTRTRMCWTLGSARSCGPSPRRAGRKSRSCSRAITPRRRSLPRATSSRCGSPAWS